MFLFLSQWCGSCVVTCNLLVCDGTIHDPRRQEHHEFKASLGSRETPYFKNERNINNKILLCAFTLVVFQ